MKPIFPAFEPDKINQYFKLGEEFSKAVSEFAAVDPKAIDPAKIYEAQRSNMEALVEANQKAAQAYEDLFRQQVVVLREAAERVQEQFEDLRSNPASAMEPQKQADGMRTTLEDTARQLADLAETAAKVNAGALEGIGKQVAANATALAAAAKR